MTKAEKQLLEDALTQAAFRTTVDVKPDIAVPTAHNDLSKGWLPSGGTVSRACSSNVYHSSWTDEKTNSQGTRELYSTALLALKALRRIKEKECMRELRLIDKMIENEELTGAFTNTK